MSTPATLGEALGKATPYLFFQPKERLKALTLRPRSFSLSLSHNFFPPQVAPPEGIPAYTLSLVLHTFFERSWKKVSTKHWEGKAVLGWGEWEGLQD